MADKLEFERAPDEVSGNDYVNRKAFREDGATVGWIAQGGYGKKSGKWFSNVALPGVYTAITTEMFVQMVLAGAQFPNAAKLANNQAAAWKADKELRERMYAAWKAAKDTPENQQGTRANTNSLLDFANAQ